MGKVDDIIALRDREKSRQCNFRNIWQSVSWLMFPQTYGINTTYSPGTELMHNLFDTTAMEEAENMASGISNNLFPAGQQFFAAAAYGDLGERQDAKDYLSYLTEKTHEQVFNSNFIAQVDNTIHYWLTFGMGALYSEFDATFGLNYRDYSIGTYQCLENPHGVIDTIILTAEKTARQLYQQYGEKAGSMVLKAYAKPESQNDVFDVIQVVRPRKDRIPGRIGNMNMPWEDITVNVEDRVLLNESGFEEFPFAIPRYQVVYREVYGRGRGTAMLPHVRYLNRMAKDYQEMVNKWVNPPKEVLESFDGTVDMTPGAENYVTQMNSIAPIPLASNGAFPVTKEILEYYREGIRQGFFKSAFEALTNLTGDRRTTTEIIERLKEGMKKLSKPLSRLFVELLTPTLTRTILLLIRNGVVAPPPESLQGSPIKIEFINPLALALRDQQARGSQYWAETLAGWEEVFPGVTDNMDADKAARELGRSLGVKTEHIRPVRERDEIRAHRAAAAEAQKKAELAMAMAEGYQKTTKAPEPGSLAAANE